MNAVPGQVLTDEQKSVIGKLKKIMDMAARGTEAEQQVAAIKFQEYLEKYNLTAESVASAAPEEGKRLNEAVRGGTFRWQVELWEAVAELNFCLHFTRRYLAKGVPQRVMTDDGRRRQDDIRWSSAAACPASDYGQLTKVIRGDVWTKRHMIVGRVVNVRATIALAQYLEQAINRATAERCRGENEADVHSNWAMSYRRGMAARISERLQDCRQKKVDAEQRAARAAEERAARRGTSTSTAITLAGFTRSEKDANRDFVAGEDGFSARQRAEEAAWRQQRAAWDAMGQAERTRHAADNPAEAAERAEEDRYWARQRGGKSERDNVDRSAYWAGSDAGKTVGLDLQLDSGRSRKIGG